MTTLAMPPIEGALNHRNAIPLPNDPERFLRLYLADGASVSDRTLDYHLREKATLPRPKGEIPHGMAAAAFAALADRMGLEEANALYTRLIRAEWERRQCMTQHPDEEVPHA